MASREKKAAVTKKQSSAALPVPLKDVESTGTDPEAIATGSDNTVPDTTNKPLAITKSQRIRNPSAIVRSLRKPAVRNTVATKKPLQLRVNSKAKLTTATGSRVRKAVLRTRTKGIDANTLMNHGVTRVVRKREPPVSSENGETKKEVAKRKRPTKLVEAPVDTINQCIDNILSETNKPVKKAPVRAKKIVKTEPVDTIDDVINDISSLIDKDEIKKESASDTDSNKPPKKIVARKQKIELLKKKLKKENLENKMDTSNSNIIDMLDLNVRTVAKKIEPKKRRHSIEKFSISNSEPGNCTMFANVPRSNSPRTRRFSKLRQSIDNLAPRRSSPYTTRSDSPAHMLRNGKHRKLKHLNLLDGLDHDYKKRRRLCSDFSGSEVSMSKLSGYESDSSFSDLASLHGAEAATEIANTDVKSEAAVIKKELLETYVNNPPDAPPSTATGTMSTSPTIAATTPAVVVKRSMSMDQPQQPEDVAVPTDTNSNLYTPDATQSSRADNPVVEPENNIPNSPSFKVPEKSLILENMKANFNDVSNEEVSVSEEVQSEQPQVQVTDPPQIMPVPVKPLDYGLLVLERGKRTTRSATKKTPTIPGDIASTSTEDTTVSTDSFYRKSETKPVEEASPAQIVETVTKVEQPAKTPPIPPLLNIPILEKVADIKPNIDVKQKLPELKPKEVLQPKEVLPYKEAIKPKEVLPYKEAIKPKEVLPYKEAIKPKEVLKAREVFTPKEVPDLKSKVPELKPRLPEIKPILPVTITSAIVFPAYTTNTIIPIPPPSHVAVPEDMDIEDSIKAHKVGIAENGNNETAEQDPIAETPENMAIKENILSALGLQSLRAAEEAAKTKKVIPVPSGATNGGGAGGTSVALTVGCSTSGYSSGTLKTVIKLNRDRSKKSRSPLKMTLQKSNRPKTAKTDQEQVSPKPDEDEYKVMKERPSTSSSWKLQAGHSSDTAGAQRKTHYSNRSNLDGSSEHTSDGDTNTAEEGTSGKLLVIPEKASSFSIHPGRVCKDECSYCFGKFGMFDTPCHIGSMKSAERQEKILATEKHLTRDSCLCDACFRHVDRKSNAPSYINNKNYKRNTLVAPGPRQNHCHVLGCANESTNILKRKWIIKMRKAVCEVINIDLDNPGLHSIPICEEHYTALEHLMVCAMCKRRLARNHIHYLGSESADLSAALNEMGIPVKLCNDKPVVCKLCKYFATLILKSIEDKTENTLTFENEYRKRLLHFHDIQVMNEEDAEGPIPVPSREKLDQTHQQPQQTNQLQQHEQQSHHAKKKRKLQKNNNHSHNPSTNSTTADNQPDNQETSRSDSPSDYMVDYQSLIPAINIETGSDQESNNGHNNKKDGATIIANRKLPIFSRKSLPPNLKPANAIGHSASVAAMRSDVAVKRLNSNTSISVRQLFPGEEDLPLNAHVDFGTIKERTPEGWEKCNSTIQYDLDTKSLWQELQKPYGNQSSFLRHLVLLEKYFRNGDLVLTPTASHHSSNYTESVQNRLRAYDNIPSQPSSSTSSSGGGNNNNTATPTSASTGTHEPTAAAMQPLTVLQYNKPPVPPNIPIRKQTPPSVSHHQLREPPLLVNAANIPKSTPISLAHLTSLVSNSGASLAIGSPATTVAAFMNSNNTIATVASNCTVTHNQTPGHSGTSNNNNNNNNNSVSPVKQNKVPPGLISLQPGTNKPVTPLVKPGPSPTNTPAVKVSPPSQKIKFPITKNWRPNLIPIDPTKKIEKRTGLVQVISGGKPYHITLEDYKKMCAIKRTFDLRQKRLQEQKSMLMMNLAAATSSIPPGVSLATMAAATSAAAAAATSSPPTNNNTPTQQVKPTNVNNNNNNSSAVMKSLVPRKSLTISKTALTRPEEASTSAAAVAAENSLEKLDKHVENLEMQFNADKSLGNAPAQLPGMVPCTPSPLMQHMPKIPKSLTVIPQTVVRKLDTANVGIPISGGIASTSGGSVVVTTPSGSSSSVSLTQAAILASNSQKPPVPGAVSIGAAVARQHQVHHQQQQQQQQPPGGKS